MSTRARLSVAAGVALLAGLYVLATPSLFPSYVSDFDQLWLGARAWRGGREPYDEVLRIHVGQGHDYGLLYPFTAVTVALPFSYLPLGIARAAFAAAGAFCFAYVVLTYRLLAWPVLLSGSFRAALSLVQVAPFLACLVISPHFGWAAAFKPNLGVVTMAGAPLTRRYWLTAATWAGALVLVSLALWPTWPIEWRDAMRTALHHTPLVMRPAGFLLLLAALRWRQPEARYLLALALVPGTPTAQEALPLLLLLPRTLRQALVMAILSHLGDISGYVLAGPSPSMPELNHARAMALLVCLYLPALAVMLRRPNQDMHRAPA